MKFVPVRQSTPTSQCNAALDLPYGSLGQCRPSLDAARVNKQLTHLPSPLMRRTSHPVFLLNIGDESIVLGNVLRHLYQYFSRIASGFDQAAKRSRKP